MPDAVIVATFAELSLKVESCRVSRLVAVPVIAAMLVPALCVAVSGAVGGVNAPVYTATPLTTLRFDMYPPNLND